MLSFGLYVHEHVCACAHTRTCTHTVIREIFYWTYPRSMEFQEISKEENQKGLTSVQREQINSSNCLEKPSGLTKSGILPVPPAADIILAGQASFQHGPAHLKNNDPLWNVFIPASVLEDRRANPSGLEKCLSGMWGGCLGVLQLAVTSSPQAVRCPAVCRRKPDMNRAKTTTANVCNRLLTVGLFSEWRNHSVFQAWLCYGTLISHKCVLYPSAPPKTVCSSSC